MASQSSSRFLEPSAHWGIKPERPAPSSKRQACLRVEESLTSTPAPSHFHNHRCAQDPAAEPRLSARLRVPRELILPHADDWFISTIFIMSLSHPRFGLLAPLLFLPNTDSTCIQGLSSIPSSPTNRTSPLRLPLLPLALYCSSQSALRAQPHPPRSSCLSSGSVLPE